jgi:DNA-binding response OmpR family regulator
MATILIIDDDEILTGMISRMLSDAGYDVQCANDGKIGLQLVDTLFFDLIVTDLVMPEKEGLETILEIRKRNKTVPIIAISGGGRMGPEHYLSMALALGADYAFQKPFDKEPFLGAVRECLSGIGPGAV